MLPSTDRNADSSTMPASLVRMQVYLPASLALTAAISKEPSSRICKRPDGIRTVVSANQIFDFEIYANLTNASV